MSASAGRTTPTPGQPPTRYPLREGQQEVAHYDYTDEDRRLLFQVVRYQPKAFRARCPDRKGGWLGSLRGVRRVLYQLPQVLAAESVLVVEGEKDVDNARSLLPDGFAATCNPFGAGKWRSEYTKALAGRTVYLCPDNDPAGRDHLLVVGLALHGAAREVLVVRLPKSLKDLSEWIERGGDRAALARLLHDAEPFVVPLIPGTIAPRAELSAGAEGEVTAAYSYTDAGGGLLFEVLRYRPKAFRTRRPDGQGGWLWGPAGCLPVLYRLPRVLVADTVLVVEGEKDVDTAERLGLPGDWAATCSPFGVCRWLPRHSDMLGGKRVLICPDNDAPGQDHLLQVGLSLIGRAREIRVVALPANIKDLSEWVEAGGDGEGFAALLRTAAPFAYPRDQRELMRDIAPLAGALERIVELSTALAPTAGTKEEGSSAGPPLASAGPQIEFAVRELARVLPGWLGIGPDGSPAVCVRGFEALATAALQELAGEIRAADEQAAQLAERIDRLAARDPPIGLRQLPRQPC